MKEKSKTTTQESGHKHGLEKERKGKVNSLRGNKEDVRRTEKGKKRKRGREERKQGKEKKVMLKKINWK